LLAERKIDISDTIEDDKFPTIVKTRIVARHQQVVRVDRETITKLTTAQIGKVVAAVKKKLPNIDAIIFEDYGKGFLTRELVGQIAREARAAKKIVTADPNPSNLIDWSGMTAVKPNRAEAFLAAGVPDRDSEIAPKKDVDLVRAGKELLQKWGIQYLLVTLGEHGVMFFEKGKHPHHIPTKARDVFDVSGAGDTAIAMFTLALACNATPLEAALIANHASAVVVGKLGTATVTRDELISSFENDFD
jgi:rfaE bifunctional protein kinase chain/domain